MTLFVVEKKKSLLPMYLTLMLHCEGFVHHVEEIFDSDGFLTDGSGMKESDLVTV